jgi:hypothetical protein
MSWFKLKPKASVDLRAMALEAASREEVAKNARNDQQCRRVLTHFLGKEPARAARRLGTNSYDLLGVQLEIRLGSYQDGMETYFSECLSEIKVKERSVRSFGDFGKIIQEY